MERAIVVLGSINFDVVARADKLPKVGETVNGSTVDMFVGGKGSNQATQMSLLGMKTYFIGQIGRDEMGGNVINSLINQGVDCRYLEPSQEYPTGCASIYVDEQGDNMLVHAPGANHHIPLELVRSASKIIEGAGILMTQNEINQDAMIEGIKLAKKHGVETLLNPAPAVALPDETFKLIDYITPNETETETYTGIMRSDHSMDEWKRGSAQWFLDKGVGNVCITLGEDGSYFYNGQEEYTVPAFKVEAVDTTAAGDAFNGGFAYAVAKGLSMEEALIIGNACGALATTTIGAQNSVKGLEEVKKFLADRDIQIKL